MKNRSHYSAKYGQEYEKVFDAWCIRIKGGRRTIMKRCRFLHRHVYTHLKWTKRCLYTLRSCNEWQNSISEFTIMWTRFAAFFETNDDDDDNDDNDENKQNNRDDDSNDQWHVHTISRFTCTVNIRSNNSFSHIKQIAFAINRRTKISNKILGLVKSNKTH